MLRPDRAMKSNGFKTIPSPARVRRLPPPLDGFTLTGFVRDIDCLVRGADEDAAFSLLQQIDLLHVPLVGLVRVDAGLRGKHVERCQAEVIDDLHGPAIASVCFGVPVDRLPASDDLIPEFVKVGASAGR
jgi:hypothetical protein